MAKYMKIILRTVELGFIVFCFFFASLFFRAQPLPSSWVEFALSHFAPTNLVVEVDGFSVGFRSGVAFDGVRVFDAAELASSTNAVPMASVDRLVVNPLARRILAVGARYPRLPASYYAPENHERNERLEATLPRLPRFLLILENPDILGAAPAKVVAEVEVQPSRVSFERIHLTWPPAPEGPMFLDGECAVDLVTQEVVGETHGTALQRQIRPFIDVLDVPVALPYIDAFTEVPGKVPASCSWHVNLVNNDFTLDLGLHPTLGRYRGVPMAKADGNLHLFVYTRGDWLNYHHQFGPIVGVGPKGEPLEGTVVVDGTNGYNTVSVMAKSALPVAHLLKIGGFEDDYVDDSVVGDSVCSLEFRFPRAMTNNYEVLNGKGHLSLRNGHLMRMKGMKGLVELLADKVPGVAWFTDVTQGSCDYVIENGILRSDNIYIEGTVFSIKMYGQFDTIKNALDFTVRVQFSKSDSIVGKILHPLAWPFTKLLLEFRVTGTANNPKWEYISVIDRVLEAVK
jgi:hypothetical protein